MGTSSREGEGSSSVARSNEDEWSPWEGEDQGKGSNTTPEGGRMAATEIRMKKLLNMEAEKKKEEETKRDAEDSTERKRAEAKRTQEEKDKRKAIETQAIQNRLQAKVRFNMRDYNNANCGTDFQGQLEKIPSF